MLFRPAAFLLLVYRAWRRLPPGQRRRLHAAARRESVKIVWRHGPRIAATVARRTRVRP